MGVKQTKFIKLITNGKQIKRQPITGGKKMTKVYPFAQNKGKTYFGGDMTP